MLSVPDHLQTSRQQSLQGLFFLHLRNDSQIHVVQETQSKFPIAQTLQEH